MKNIDKEKFISDSETMSLTELSEKYAISRDTAQMYRRRFGIEKKAIIKYDDNVIIRIKELINNGETIKDIAKIINIPYSSVWYLMQKNIPKSELFYSKTGKLINKENFIIDCEKMSLSELAKKYQVSIATISNLKKRFIVLKKTPKKYNDKIRNEVIEMRKKGIKISDISKKTGIKYNTVYYILQNKAE